jgi:hypothetical protein
MAETVAHLVDRVLPDAPVHQWVLSLPFGLRCRLAHDAHLTRDVLPTCSRRASMSLRRRARLCWPTDNPQCESVTFVQRFGAPLNLSVGFSGSTNRTW